MQVICLQEDAFYALLEEVVQRVTQNLKSKEEKWINTEKAMAKLGISSKATLQKYRDEGRIRFTQPDKKIILYDSDSIDDFLNKHSKSPFTFL